MTRTIEEAKEELKESIILVDLLFKNLYLLMRLTMVLTKRNNLRLFRLW